MGHSRWFKVFFAAGAFVPADASASERHVAVHRRIVVTSIVCLILFGALGTISLLLETPDAAADSKEGEMLWFATLVFGAAGMIFGAALGCLFAPHSFLASQSGAKWLRLIGTQSVRTARIVCSILVVLAASGVVALIVHEIS